MKLTKPPKNYQNEIRGEFSSHGKKSACAIKKNHSVDHKKDFKWTLFKNSVDLKELKCVEE